MPIFRNIPLTFKMTLISIVIGVAAWGLLDPIHRRTMQESFGRELNERVEQESRENRMLFDDYVNRYMQSAKILMSQKALQDYVHAQAGEWAASPARKDRITYHRDTPSWMPANSVIRSLPHMHYVFLLDKSGSAREAFLIHPEPPPGELLNPSSLLLLLSHEQAFITIINSVPYLIASERLSDRDGNDAAILLLADPLDDVFMRESLGAIYSNKLVALVSLDPPVIVQSSHSDILIPGTPLSALQDRYLYAGRGFFDFGSTALQLNFMTFLPTRPYEHLSESILRDEWINRIVTASILILSLTLLMYWVTKRIQRVTDNVRDFSENELKMKQPYMDGDEIAVLEQRFRRLSEEIRSSHESIQEKVRMLREERDRAQDYLDTAASIFLVIGMDYKVVLINKKGCEILEYREEELIGRDWFETALSEEYQKDAKNTFDQFISASSCSDMYFESAVLTKKGERRIIGWHNTLLKDGAGSIIGVLGSGADVTDRKRAEEELLNAHQMLETKVRERTAELEEANAILHESERRFRETLTSINMIAVQLDTDGNILFANNFLSRLTGWERHELIGKNWMDIFIPQEIRDTIKSLHHQNCLSERLAEHHENNILLKNGELRLISWTNSRLRDHTGTLIGITSIGADISEKKKIEKALMISEERFRGAFEAAALGMALISPEGKWLKVNSTLCNIVGYSKEEMLAMKFQDVTHPDDLDANLEYVRKTLAGEIPNYFMEKRYLHRDGHVVWTRVSVSLVRDENGVPLYFVSQIQDITRRKKAELQVEASLKEKEVLLQEIHHRVKNNMTVISSLLKLQSDKVTDEHYRELFKESINRIKSMALIHEKLYRSDDLARIVFSDYLKDMTDSIVGSYGMNALNIHVKKELETITLSLDTSIPCGLIVNELLSNSLKYAFPDRKSGEISLSLRKRNGTVELTVGDNGVGLPADLDVRNADSLGLNIVNALVKQIRGNIRLRREQGTEFHITFRSDTE